MMKELKNAARRISPFQSMENDLSVAAGSSMEDNRNTRGPEAIVGPHNTYMAMTPETTSHDCPEWKRR